MLGTISAKAKEELKKAYIKAARAAKNKISVDSINHLSNRYNSIREFAIACELLTFQECEQIEYVGDNEMLEEDRIKVKLKKVTGVSPLKSVLDKIRPTGKVSDLDQITTVPEKLKKLPALSSKGFYDSIAHDPLRALVRELNVELETKVVEGLERKGYTFPVGMVDLQEFVAKHVNVLNNVDGSKTYYVKGDPFFYHKPDLNVTTQTKDRSVVMTANNGSYSFL